MARKLRVQYTGAIYHVINRGDHREAVFHDAHDPELFLATLSEACTKTDWQIHSFCSGREQFARAMEAHQRSCRVYRRTSSLRLVRGQRAIPPGTTPANDHRIGSQLRRSGVAGKREKKAFRILNQELHRRGWDLEQLKHRRKGDPQKIQIARRLRDQTTMTLAWIAQYLSMGSAGSLANSLRSQPP